MLECSFCERVGPASKFLYFEVDEIAVCEVCQATDE
jgi:hypothetical protein